uniref:Uncharacterized protein n=1 Tax=Panagrolaimus sp. JU765 TaxID=591449 RepID=A0AC34PYN9_9BILA
MALNFGSGLWCLGLAIFTSFEILVVLCYFAALHNISVWIVALITGILAIGPAGFCLFRVITDVLNARIQNPTDVETRKKIAFCVCKNLLGLILFVGLAAYNFYLSKHGEGTCQTGRQCYPQIFLFAAAFGVLLVEVVTRLSHAYAARHQNPVAVAEGYGVLDEQR